LRCRRFARRYPEPTASAFNRRAVFSAPFELTLAA